MITTGGKPYNPSTDAMSDNTSGNTAVNDSTQPGATDETRKRVKNNIRRQKNQCNVHKREKTNVGATMGVRTENY